MRWRFWLGACVVWTCTQRTPRPGAECRAIDEGRACQHSPAVEACLAASQTMVADTGELCERAWRDGGDEAAAVAGAYFALNRPDAAALERWAQRARPTLQGARIFSFSGEMRQRRDDRPGAERSFRRALDLQIDRDPARAANTALWLFALVQDSQSAAESIRLARLAWEQAELSGNELIRACAASSLVEILVDIGELSTAAAVIDHMDAGGSGDWRAVRDFALGRLEAARGRTSTAIALFRRASQRDPAERAARSDLPYDAFELVRALLGDGQVAEARRELERARELVQRGVLHTDDILAQLATAEASVDLAEGDAGAALASAELGLAIRTRDDTRVRLLHLKGEALVRRGDPAAAEQVLREAADSVEAWRESIPTTQLRSSIVARNRYVLESLLELAGQLGDVASALEATRRMIGRGLLDRIYQREANAPATADASIRDLEKRLEVRQELGVTMVGTSGRGDLRAVTHDMVAIMLGARSVWAIRHARGQWSITRVGDRQVLGGWLDAYRGDIDDPRAAGQLGNALFPEATLPEAGAPLVVALDPELSDVALPGLRVAGNYLVERVAILEVLSPDLLLTPVPRGPWGVAVAIGDPMNDLSDADGEIHAMAGATGASEHLGSAATRAALETGDHASVLHVATHSRIEDGRAAFVLSDGVLSSSEIMNLRIAPRLAVIATCRSQVDDDPVRSLVAAFLAAGSPAVIGVKRALGDRDGAALMRDFYHFHGATDPLRALASAQRAAIAADLPPHAWATVSFFGVGGWLEH
jgi:tetratricopeptide (TPR) repeat protein